MPLSSSKLYNQKTTNTSFVALPERTYLLIAVGLLMLYVMPYIWLGEGAYLTIHDNLDCELLYLYLLKITNTAFDFDAQTVIPNIMNGVPRSALRSGLNLEVLSFYLLPPYVAYIINFVAVHSIGFIGMYLLLKKHVLPESSWGFTRVALAFLFAIVPGYIIHGVSISGQPLLLYAFLNLLNQKRTHWTDWLIIVVFPFYSFFVWSGLFICVALGILGLTSMLQRKQVSWRYITGLALLSALYLVSEWQMIYSFLARTYVSQRTEYDYAQLLSLSIVDSIRKTADLFIRTYYHAGSFLTLWMLAVIGLTIIRSYRSGNYEFIRQLGLGVSVVLLICLCSGFYRFPAIWLGKGNLLQSFQFDRFYFLLPLFWFYLFSLSLRAYPPAGSLNRLFLLGQLVIMLVANKEWAINIGKITGIVNEEQYPSYQAFYAPKLFGEIRDYIGRPQAAYRIANIGIHPAVALYSGFYTLDSYQNNYLLSYKHTFRRIIANELAKAPAIRTYYDAYGCRCYTFSAELGMSTESALCGKHKARSIANLSLNTSALESLGGQYILSAVPVQNAAENRLHLEKVFDDPGSYWRIWLYKVVKQPDTVS